MPDSGGRAFDALLAQQIYVICCVNNYGDKRGSGGTSSYFTEGGFDSAPAMEDMTIDDGSCPLSVNLAGTLTADGLKITGNARDAAVEDRINLISMLRSTDSNDREFSLNLSDTPATGDAGEVGSVVIEDRVNLISEAESTDDDDDDKGCLSSLDLSGTSIVDSSEALEEAESTVIRDIVNLTSALECIDNNDRGSLSSPNLSDAPAAGPGDAGETEGAVIKDSQLDL